MQAQDPYVRAAVAIRDARRVTAFTGAGVSVESGIPPFRGEGGLWSRYDPVFLEIGHFRRHPRRSWELIKEIFYDYFGAAEPNAAHQALAALEQQGQLQTVRQGAPSSSRKAASWRFPRLHRKHDYRTAVYSLCVMQLETLAGPVILGRSSSESLPCCRRCWKPRCRRCCRR